jgi:hypothetical protein
MANVYVEARPKGRPEGSAIQRARSRSPEIVENIENRGQRMDSLECPNALAKQVLSQLSYTPTR